MATDLVTLAQAQAHLKLDAETFAIEQPDIALKLASATARVLKHIEREENDWTSATDPTVDLDFAIVQSAILALLGEFYRWRGDDALTEDVIAGAYLSANVRRHLHPLRRPSLA